MKSVSRKAIDEIYEKTVGYNEIHYATEAIKVPLQITCEEQIESLEMRVENLEVLLGQTLNLFDRLVKVVENK